MGGRSAALILYAALLSSLGGTGARAASGVTPVAAPPQQLEEIAIVGERPGPRLWKVTHDDHVLWLLGTLNHLPKRMTWRSSEVDAVLSQSQQLLTSGPAVSTGVGPIGAIRLYLQWHRAQKNPDRLKLNSWLPGPLYARFEALKARFDAGDNSIEELRPGFAALRLYERAGTAPARRIPARRRGPSHLANRRRAAGKRRQPTPGQRPHGRDTFTLVFRNLGPEQFGNAFQRFMV